MAPLYFDHNATGPPRPEVLERALPLFTELWGNPSSGHALGRRPAAEVDNAREMVAAWAGARPRDVVFTSGATEANHLALRGGLAARPGRLLVSSVEHPSILEPGELLGAELLPVDSNGRVRLDIAEERLAAGASLVSVQAANNETGVLQPLAELATLAHAAGALLHVDAAQVPGRMDAPSEWDLLTLTGHKAGGFKGVGALVLRPDLKLVPQQLGGSQERNRRAGTVNTGPIVALGEVCRLGAVPGLLALRQRLEEGAKALGALVTGAQAPRLPNTVHLRFPGVPGDSLVMALDGLGVCASAGAACASGAAKASPVLLAMGLPATEGVRLSMGWNSRVSDVEQVLAALGEALRRHRAAEELFA